MTMSSSVTGLFGLYLQGIAVLLGCVSAYYIWRQLTQLVLSGQASVSERLASQSIEIIEYIADDPRLYEYFYQNEERSVGGSEGIKVLCCAEIFANFLEHVVLQRLSLPRTSRDAWMRYVRDHYNSSRVVREFVSHHRDWYAREFLKIVESDKRS
jgi:hypothetical protein